MPWHLESKNPACKGIAVVDDETEEVVGCHDLEDDAQAQLAALKAEPPPGRDQPRSPSATARPRKP